MPPGSFIEVVDFYRLMTPKNSPTESAPDSTCARLNGGLSGLMSARIPHRPLSPLPKKPSQPLSHRPCRRFVESPDLPINPPRLDACDLCCSHHRRRGQTCAFDIDDRDVTRPGLVIRAGDHRHPYEPVNRELAVRDHEGRATLLGETIGIGKWHDDDIEGVVTRLRIRHGRACPGHPRLACLCGR
jgi:hypothetical protein